MLNKKKYAAIIANAAPVEAAAAAVIAKANEMGVTPTTNMDRVREEYKTLLFSQLVAVDKGLKKRFDMHRTEKAKVDLINSSVSLEGYQEMTDLEELIEAYKHTIPYEFTEPYSGNTVTPEDFITKYEGRVAAAYEGKVIDVTDTDLYKEFKALADTLNSLYERGVMDKYSFMNGFYRLLSEFLPASSLEQRVDVSEEKIYSHLKRKSEDEAKQV